jgi:hypothetical protein
MKRKIIIVNILLCMLIGEIMLRFDETFKLFADNHVVEIPTTIAITQEYNMLKANTIDLTKNDLRVMVIGDSYISGAGIESKDNFSQQLKGLLKKSDSTFDSIYVFDASVPKNNNLDNNETYFQYVDKFKPEIIVLGYNYNDVMENLDRKNEKNVTDSFAKRSSYQKETNVLKKMMNFAFRSKFIHYLHTNLYTQFKARGIIFPNSDFDVIMKSYSNNTERWIKSKIYLQEIIEDAKKRNIQLIVLQCPQTDLMAYPKLFVKADSAIKHFFTSSPSLIYENIADIFKGKNPKDYMLSKYDGHSNERAHKEIAENVFALIKKQPGIKERLGK